MQKALFLSHIDSSARLAPLLKFDRIHYKTVRITIGSVCFASVHYLLAECGQLLHHLMRKILTHETLLKRLGHKTTRNQRQFSCRKTPFIVSSFLSYFPSILHLLDLKLPDKSDPSRSFPILIRTGQSLNVGAPFFVPKNYFLFNLNSFSRLIK